MTRATGTSDRIAIVGLAGRFPACADAGELWRLIFEGREATSWPSDDALLAAGASPDELADPNYVRATLRLPDFDGFDAGFFGFSPKEAAIMDPQHRHFLECCHAALEDAGRPPARFEGAIGVFGGCGMQSYFARNLLRNAKLMADTGLFLVRHTGNDKDFLTTRVSYALGLDGPSVGVQTACSTSLVAVHMACQSLLAGECDMALAGGVSIEVPHGQGYRYAENEILSRDGHCRAFDDAATGTLFGSGAAVVVLRRLDDALADGDNIQAVILGSAINNDGAGKAGYLAPGVDGQARAAEEALAIAGVDPATIDYIEAHGTGTVIGDPIELSALQQAYGGDPDKGRIGIGSIKSNIGHLDTAAGVTSLIKMVLALKHEAMPASLNCDTPNRRFDFADSAFRVVRAREKWPRGVRPRRAAVNSLGVGGTNAHVIIEEAPAVRPAAVPVNEWPQVLAFSARSEAALDVLESGWRRFAENAGPGVSFDAALFTARDGRDVHPWREAVVSSGFRELADRLADTRHPARVRGRAADGASLVFMYPGGGAQYPGAGRELFRDESVFRSAALECLGAMDTAVARDLEPLLFGGADDSAEARQRLEQPLNSVLSVFTISHALTRLLASWGITPDCVIGHSAGDYAAAVVSGVMSVRDAVMLLTERGRIFDRMPAGGMIALDTGEEDARRFAGSELDVAAINGPRMTVLSGSLDAISGLEKRLAGTNVSTRRVPIRVAAHSRDLDPFIADYRARLEAVRLSRPVIPFISGLSGSTASDAAITRADYWCHQLRDTVRFGAGLQSALSSPDRILVEIGPGQALTNIARQITAAHKPGALVPTMRHVNDASSDRDILQLAAAQIWCCGGHVDLAATGDDGKRGRISIPTYPFEHARHWIDADPARSSVPGRDEPAGDDRDVKPGLRPLADREQWFSSVDWAERPLPPPTARTPGRWLVIENGRSPLAGAVASILRSIGHDVVSARMDQGDQGSTVTTFDPHCAASIAEFVRHLRTHAPGVDCIVWPVAATAAQDVSSAEDAFAEAFSLMKALIEEDLRRDVEIVFLTDRAWSVGDEPARNPGHSAVLGPARVVSREMPSVRARVVDIGTCDHTDGVLAPRVVEEILADGQPDLVALRGGKRFVEATLRATLPAVPSARLRDRGVYIVTGASGGLARLLTRHLAETRRARLVMLSRVALPDRRGWQARGGDGDQVASYIRHIRDIEALGAACLPLCCDVTRSEDVAGAVAAARAAYGAVNGVFHLAGHLDDAPMAAKSIESALNVLRPKIAGAANLDRQLADGSLDFFSVVSSTSIDIAPAGQADYVAANVVAEAIANRRKDGFVLRFGIWNGVGMTAPKPLDLESGARGSTHPLLGSRVKGDGPDVRFMRHLKASDSWVVSEHLVSGRPVMPGSAYLDIAHAAARAVMPGSALTMESCNFASAMVFGPGETRLLTTTLVPSGKGSFRLTIESGAQPSGPSLLHFEASLRSRRAASPVRADAVRPGGTDVALGPVTSDRFAQRDGISFGPRFEVLKSIGIDRTRVVATLALPDGFSGDLSRHDLHPALLDIAATIGLHSISEADRSGRLFVPMSIDEVTVLSAVPAGVTVHARRRTGGIDGIETFDVDIIAEGERLIVRIRGFAMRAVEPRSLGHQEGGDPGVAIAMRAGLRAADFGFVFERAMSAPTRRIVASSVSTLEMRALAVSREPKKVHAARAHPAAGVAYADAQEEQIAAICADLLGLDAVRPEDEFFRIGGHSLVAVRFLARIRKQFGVDLPMAVFFRAPSIRALASVVASASAVSRHGSGTLPADASAPGTVSPPVVEWSPLVPMDRGTAGQPTIFCIHGAGGNVLSTLPLVSAFQGRFPFYGVQAYGVDGATEPLASIPLMAERYIAAIDKIVPDGPICLIGYSGGGVIAFEMLHMLAARGRKVELCLMIDSLAPLHGVKRSILREWVGYGRDQGIGSLAGQVLLRLTASLRKRGLIPVPRVSDVVQARSDAVFDSYMQAQAVYEPPPLETDIVLVRALKPSVLFHRAGRHLGWERLVEGNIEVHEIDADHDSIVTSGARRIAAIVTDRIDANVAGEAGGSVLPQRSGPGGEHTARVPDRRRAAG